MKTTLKCLATVYGQDSRIFYAELKKRKMKSKKLWINIFVFVAGVIIGYLVFHVEDKKPVNAYVQDKIYEKKYYLANKKYDSLRVEFEKKPKQIKIQLYEKIRDTIYILDSIGTDSLQRELLRHYINNKKRFDPHRFDFIGRQ